MRGKEDPILRKLIQKSVWEESTLPQQSLGTLVEFCTWTNNETSVICRRMPKAHRFRASLDNIADNILQDDR